MQNEKIAREFAAYYNLFSKYREDYRIEDILAGQEDVATVSGRAKNTEFDERLSLVGLMLDSLCGGMRAVNQRTQVMVGLRDILRQVKALAAEEGADSAEELAKCVVERQSKLEMQVAAGTITKAKRGQEEAVIAELSELARVCAGDGFAAVEARYGQMVASIAPETQKIDSKLVNAFALIQGAFGDKQELLVFTTELTSRVDSAKYIAQYVGASHNDHSENMILSTRQRDSRCRVEDLGL